MSALVSLPPSPVMPRSPDSFSSRSSSPSSGSSSQPPLPTYTSFDITKLGQARPITFSQPLQPPSNAATRRSARPTHRSSQSMSRLHYPAVQVVDFATTAESTHTRRTHHSAKSVGTFDSGNAAAAMAKEESKDAGTVDKSRSRPTPQRSRTLSFSATQQAFLPSRSHLSASVSSAAAGLPFPTVDEGKAASSVALDRTSSVGSSASASVRRPRPSRVSLSARSGSSLRVPAATSASRADHNASEYLEAKVVILGSQGVGKTSLITRSTTGRFSAARTSTIGASLLAKKLVIDNTKVHLQLWDAAGQERFRTLAPLFYRGALAAVLVYDVTDEASLQDVKFWMAELRKNMPDELIVLVVGAKADLAGTCPTIPLIQAQRSVAVWRDEMERAENGEVASAPASGFLPKGSNGNTGGANGRSSSPAATRFSRPRTYSTPTSTTVPTITTTGPPPTPPHTASESGFSSRLRYNAMHPSSGSISPPSPRLGASSSSVRPTHTLSSSATMPDLSGYTLAGLPHRDSHLAMNRTASTDSSQSQNSSATSGTTGSSGGHSFSPPPPPPGPPSRSSSSFGLMSFLPGGGGRGGGSGSGGVTGAGAEYGSSSVSSSVATLSGSHHHALTSALTPTRRRSLEDRAATSPSSAGVGALLLRENLSSHSAARRAAAAAEEARLDALVAACPIEVLEVSAKDGFGVEDVFRSIAEQLLEHKAEIERRQQTLRRKDSIILREADAQEPAATAAAGACAC
ncbi:hypothetical protein JCM8115_000363 [Rhodotorula mucilaginosa]